MSKINIPRKGLTTKNIADLSGLKYGTIQKHCKLLNIPKTGRQYIIYDIKIYWKIVNHIGNAPGPVPKRKTGKAV